MTTETSWASQLLSGGLTVWAILIIVGVILIWYIIIKYNKLVSLRNLVKNAFADVDVQMKLRFDLVENLVNTVKGYAIHEKETLTNVIQARFYECKKWKWKIRGK